MTTRDLSQLRAHVRDFHPRLSARSNADLSARHHRDHFRYVIRDHIHTGAESPIVNLGDSVIKLMRPEGWATGKGAVEGTMHDRHMQDAITRSAGLVPYRWRGVNRRGVAMSGMTTLAPASVARLVETYWRQGWREFLICSGDGPVPPAADDPSPVCRRDREERRPQRLVGRDRNGGMIMAQWRPFGYEGKPGTCLWCGRKLRRKTYPPDKPKGMGWAEWHASPESKQRVPAYDKPGDYGDGFFCGLRCAYDFAVRLAELGRRLEARS